MALPKLTREQFVTALNYYIDSQRRFDRLNDALQVFAPSDFTGIADCKYLPLYLEWLADVMGDDEDTIAWWVYDCECGHRKDLCHIWDGEPDEPDAIRYDIFTAGDLYDYLLINALPVPTKSELNSIVKQQEMGVKYALKVISDMIDTNTKTANKDYETRNALMRLIYGKIADGYVYETGIDHLPTPDDVHLFCLFDEDDPE